MSEIEKMYMRCKIKKQQTCSNSDTCYNGSLDECEGCNSYHYPPFTAEKQIEILKLLTNRCDLTISHFTEWEFIHFDGQEPIQITGKDFTETFAKLINAYWQDLTEKEKQQVKGILE